ncbi:MAG: DinB family protein [Bacteroidota bacterium]
MLQKETVRIAQQLRLAQDGAAWHGPNLEEVLTGINAEDAAKHPIEGAHSIWELVLHITAWREFGLQMLAGEGSYDPDKDWTLNFPPTPAVNAENWQHTLAKLKESSVRLSEKIGSYTDEKLQEKVPNREYDFYKLMHGIVQHDLYHGGQLILLKKLIT